MDVESRARRGLPVAVVGAGPIGLAAAAHLLARGLEPVILERGPQAGAAILEWGHVRLFSPWRYNLDSAAQALLGETGWRAPDPERLPTGAEFVARYLTPLADHPSIAPRLNLRAEVTGLLRDGPGNGAARAAAPLLVRWRDAAGMTRSTRVAAVIDASGTWATPNPMGVDGAPVPGERAAVGRIAYGIPDVLRRARADYAGRRVLVVGGGHSAINVALDLLRLRQRAPGTAILWALRRAGIDSLVGGGTNDRLPARGALGTAARHAIAERRIELLAPFRAEHVALSGDGVAVAGKVHGEPRMLHVDRIVVATGFRPDLAILGALRMDLDPILEAPSALAPLIDPDLHSCGTVPPHGAAELAHPEPNVFVAGSKSYGRAPTFLMMTGHEQVRSIAAALAGDHEAARRVELVLPETGVCTGVAGAADPCCAGTVSQAACGGAA